MPLILVWLVGVPTVAIVSLWTVGAVTHIYH
jgi:hypothetical protein